MSLMWEDVGSDRGIHTLFLQTGSMDKFGNENWDPV